jgi:hypothetical protein
MPLYISEKKDRKQYRISVTIPSMQSAVIMQVKKPTWQARWCTPKHSGWAHSHYRYLESGGEGGVCSGGRSDNELSTSTDGCLCSLLYFPNRKNKKQVSELCPPISIFKFTDIHETSYKSNAVGRHPNAVTFNFLQLEFTTWRMCKLVRRKRP